MVGPIMTKQYRQLREAGFTAREALAEIRSANTTTLYPHLRELTWFSWNS